MKNMHKKLTVFALSGLLVTAAGSALAFGGHHQREDGCNHRQMVSPMGGLSRLNDLSDEQKTQLQQIRKESRTALRDLRDQMRDTKDELRDAMSGQADLDNIRQLAQKQGEQMTNMIVLRAETHNKINAVLSEEQRQRLQQTQGWTDGFRRSEGGQRF
jgi:Spy/CpxP family protein refolding chaperone